MLERRKHVRHTVSLTGWIVRAQNDQPVVCRITNMSDDGAGFSLATNGVALPPEFDLFLTSNFSVGRKCLLVWQSERSVGVSFTGKIEQSDEDETDAARSDISWEGISEILKI